MLTIGTLNHHAEAIRAHERELAKFGAAGTCAPDCPHNRAPQVGAVRADLGDEVALDWNLFLVGEGDW